MDLLYGYHMLVIVSRLRIKDRACICSNTYTGMELPSGCNLFSNWPVVGSYGHCIYEVGLLKRGDYGAVCESAIPEILF